jgi:hypothetical protein
MKNDLNSWEKSRILGNLIATILIPVVIVLVANWYTSAMKERELSIKYVELAIGILREEPKKDSEDIRIWAVDIVNTYSKVKISKSLKEKLLLESIKIKVDKALDDFFNDIDAAEKELDKNKMQ